MRTSEHECKQMSMYLCLCCITLHVYMRCGGEQERGLYEDQAAIGAPAPCTHRTDSPRVGRTSHARRCERTPHLHQTNVLASSRNPRHTKPARLPVRNTPPHLAGSSSGLGEPQETHDSLLANSSLTGLAWSARLALHSSPSFPSIFMTPWLCDRRASDSQSNADHNQGRNIVVSVAFSSGRGGKWR